VQFDVDEETNGPVTFTHSSGDTIQEPADKLTLAGESVQNEDLPAGDIDDSGNDGLSVGDTITADINAGAANGEEIRVVFSAEGESDTSALITYTLSNQD
jgi:hypothetical protein